MKNSKYILPTGLLLVGLIVGFGGGYFFKGYQNQKVLNSFRNGSGSFNGQRMTASGIGQRNGNGYMGVGGEIISLDDKSVTIKLSDGSSKTILLSDKTSYSNFQEAKKENLKNGIKIMVSGKTNSDGSITADRVQLNPVVLPKP